MLNTDLQKVTKYLIDFGEEAVEALEDGWQWADSFRFLDNLASTPGALKAAPGAWAAIQAQTEEERTEWVQYIKDEFDIADDDAEAKAEAIIGWMAQTAKLVMLLIPKKNP